MFEKEADLAETEMLIHCHGDYSKKKNYREGWQDGAEFGYNKAKEEMQEQIEKLIKENEEMKSGLGCETCQIHLEFMNLNKQIEKMKCCGNCAKRGHICVAEEMQGNLCGKNKVKWELRR